MKAVRTREEDLDELKRRRKNVIAKAESAEKKLSRMSPEVRIGWEMRIYANLLLNYARTEQKFATTNGVVEQPSGTNPEFRLGHIDR